MASFAWDARILTDPGPESHPADVKNFIAPPWPLHFWREPIFSGNLGDAERQLAIVKARNSAAIAALTSLDDRTDLIAVEVERRLRPLEDKMEQIATTLADLERAASAAELADAAADEAQNVVDSNECQKNIGSAASREVQIVRNDPSLRYDSNLSVDLLNIIYASRGAANSGVAFGTWYRTLQNSLIAENPSAARKIDYRDGRMSRTFIATAITSLQSCGRLYVGTRNYSSLESAVLCLYAFYTKTGANVSHPSSFKSALESVPIYLDHMSASLASTDTRQIYGFDTGKLPKDSFAAPSGKYERGALSDHSVLRALANSRVLPPSAGSIPRGDVAPELDADQSVRNDEVNAAAAALLGRAQPLFLMEDQTLLRATLDTIVALLLLRRLLWNTNIYSARVKNQFQLGAFVPGVPPDLTVGASVDTPGDVIKSDGRNLTFLFQRYVVPVYSVVKGIELTQLFPGLVALCLDVPFSDRGLYSTRTPPSRIIDVSLSKYQASLVKLISLELQNRSRANVVSVCEVIATHDLVTLQYERGLESLMQVQRPRTRFFETKKALAFNVETDYDLLYFVCLGYIPRSVSAS
ncbi:UL25 protein [Gallid alphaherpesvirus 3]|nr:UL25 protein [Gallid alphaherpesvirus 3]AEI00228.1 UL25 protein [Gallid alphaherpesvirus 3]QEY02232.1 UL25 protein [Gallid alphaherpesvirus 3]